MVVHTFMRSLDTGAGLDALITVMAHGPRRWCNAVMTTSLDIPTLPLNGRRLIEAGAGTGKTFTWPRSMCGWCWAMAVTPPIPAR